MNCKNCDRPVGRLENLEVYRNELVCTDCHKKLAKPKPKGRSNLRLLFWIGIALWFGPTLLIVGLGLMSNDPNAPAMAAACGPISLVGALIAIVAAVCRVMAWGRDA